MLKNSKLREESGSVSHPASDWLTNFLYVLMRDSTPTGEVERIVQELESEPRNVDINYTNGWLANYAKNLADRIRRANND